MVEGFHRDQSDEHAIKLPCINNYLPIIGNSLFPAKLAIQRWTFIEMDTDLSLSWQYHSQNISIYLCRNIILHFLYSGASDHFFLKVYEKALLVLHASSFSFLNNFSSMEFEQHSPMICHRQRERERENRIPGQKRWSPYYKAYGDLSYVMLYNDM